MKHLFYILAIFLLFNSCIVEDSLEEQCTEWNKSIQNEIDKLYSGGDKLSKETIKHIQKLEEKKCEL